MQILKRMVNTDTTECVRSETSMHANSKNLCVHPERFKTKGVNCTIQQTWDTKISEKIFILQKKIITNIQVKKKTWWIKIIRYATYFLIFSFYFLESHTQTLYMFYQRVYMFLSLNISFHFLAKSHSNMQYKFAK